MCETKQKPSLNLSFVPESCPGVCTVPYQEGIWPFNCLNFLRTPLPSRNVMDSTMQHLSYLALYDAAHKRKRIKDYQWQHLHRCEKCILRLAGMLQVRLDLQSLSEKYSDVNLPVSGFPLWD